MGGSVSILEILVSILASVFILISIFLVFRAFVLWYWKVNVIVSKLDAVVEELKKINNSLERMK